MLPPESGLWQRLEVTIKALVESYGYREIRLPILERTELFKRSIGEVTDIVEKEMYTFVDRNGDSLTLRPEGTAGCVRAGIEHGLFHNQQQRLWYLGPMFRHERPQKGRYRQFHQVGVESFGIPGPDVDAELIVLGARLWAGLGLSGVRLEINTLGDARARARYRERLVAYLSAHRTHLDADALRRLESNPLRVLDSKNPEMAELIAGAPALIDELDPEALAHYEALKGWLDRLGIHYVENPRLVRGLDYYNRTVFEWISDQLGAQGTICAGGRYDGLVEQLGGRSTPAAGFAIGLERLLDLVRSEGRLEESDHPHAYLVMVGPRAEAVGRPFAEGLRDGLPRLRLLANSGGGSFKSQLRRADRSGARLALILGEDEAAGGWVQVKYLREDREQERVALSELSEFLRATIDTGGQSGS